MTSDHPKRSTSDNDLRTPVGLLPITFIAIDGSGHAGR